MTALGKFELLAELGKGAMGMVYRARDPKLNRQVALKTIAPAFLSQPQARARFEREAQAAARLQHPNVVTIFELGEADGTLFIAMELLEGMDLAQLMTDAAPPLSRDQKVRIVVDICRGLDYAHKQGVIHRDVKPANIRVTPEGTVKIVDFGIARVGDAAMTQTGLVLGTPSYMAPEVLEGKPPDHRADMWAVGCILYELLSRKRPFESHTIPALVYKVVHESPRPFDAQGLGLPPALGEVVTKALARKPDDRFPDLAAMAQALEQSVGFTGREAPLPAAARERAYELNYEEARRRLSENDLEGALAAARRAQALAPSRTGIVSLIAAIEEQLDKADTLSRPARPAPVSMTLPAARPASSTGTSMAAQTSLPIPADVSLTRLPTPVLTELRQRGAAAFRELATFGERPDTHAVCAVKDLMAVAGADGALRLWDLHSRTKVATLRSEMHQRTGHDAIAVSLAFSPDGELLASGHVDGLVRLWDIGRAQEVPVRLRHEDVVLALTFSPDGATLASGSLDANVRLWDVGAAMSGEARRELHRQPAGVTAIAYGLGGDTLLTGHTNGILRLVDARSGRLIATLRGMEGQVTLLALAPDGRHVAAGAGRDRTIRVFDLEGKDKRQTAVLAGHKKPVTSLAFFAEGLHLASVSQENVVHLWDAQSGAPMAALWGASGETFAGVALFGGDDHLAVALRDGRIRVFGPAA